MSNYEDPHWPRASAWLTGSSSDSTVGTLGLIGAPLNHSISPGRCDLAPAAVRKAMHRLSTYDIENGVEAMSLACKDFGDLPIAAMKPEEALAPISDAVRGALAECSAVVLLGGDNGITRPAMHGLGVPLNRCGLVTLDQHLDLRTLEGGLINGNPVRALLDDGLPGENIVQIGIASFANSKEYKRIADDAGIAITTMDTVHETGIDATIENALDSIAEKADVIYFDLDVDVLDRAFAPACPGARPGGLLPSQVKRAAFLMGRHPKVKAMDLVEVDPEKDINDTTCLATGMFLLSFACGLVARLR
ncbi:MAG: agmatinase family protein [Armatimonadetes bacterium]|nr:agmatinase family protein [Armatimonadota bacterium]